ncbi:MAG: acetyl-CoA carboxylase biotin carboxyl carrier protein, partial [Lachnospira sp.]|nr:acetyl-CoA carboxylase biotin carboxyl carrier protein [Lachnospira sp.]
IQTDSVNATVSGNAAIQAAPQENVKLQEEQGNIVKSPLVGIFYSAPSPDDEPFVSEGTAVKKGQTLGIIEAMKLMNEIESDYEGTVKKILVENGQMVEFGQPLFVIG